MPSRSIFRTSRSSAATVIRMTPWLAFIGLVLGLAGVSGAQGTAAEEMAEVIHQFDRALEQSDAAALKRLVAPKFSSLIGGECDGQPAERDGRNDLIEMAETLANFGVTYTRERQSLDVRLLGGGPIGVVRSRVKEMAVWSTGSMGGESDEVYYLNRINGRYQIISLSGQEDCDAVVRTGDAPG